MRAGGHGRVPRAPVGPARPPSTGLCIRTPPRPGASNPAVASPPPPAPRTLTDPLPRAFTEDRPRPLRAVPQVRHADLRGLPISPVTVRERGARMVRGTVERHHADVMELPSKMASAPPALRRDTPYHQGACIEGHPVRGGFRGGSAGGGSLQGACTRRGRVLIIGVSTLRVRVTKRRTGSVRPASRTVQKTIRLAGRPSRAPARSPRASHPVRGGHFTWQRSSRSTRRHGAALSAG